MSDLSEQSSQALREAIAGLHGTTRPGQQTMTDQVAASLDDQVHLLVQAGTGTGKSLGYLIPSMIWAMESEETVVVATATLALQAQLAKKDIPVAARAVASILEREPRTQILKGRSNYVCLLRVRDQAGAEQDSLVGGA
ncbi:MAG: ATP-dependent DNA helicase, partial [Propionibacterium sp.]|nr:ATP-dependent DNA helicase [Propionibacterium sp.]